MRERSKSMRYRIESVKHRGQSMRSRTKSVRERSLLVKVERREFGIPIPNNKLLKNRNRNCDLPKNKTELERSELS